MARNQDQGGREDKGTHVTIDPHTHDTVFGPLARGGLGSKYFVLQVNGERLLCPVQSCRKALEKAQTRAFPRQLPAFVLGIVSYSGSKG